VLKDIIGINVTNRAELLNLFQEYNEAKREYDQIKGALKMVKQAGYGIATPTLSDMKLDTPEIIRQGSRYGVKLKAVAPSIHMIRVDVESTFEPIIGSELQSKELMNYLMKDYETEPNNIWKSEIFGRSLDVIVQEGIQAKLSLMPDNVRYKLQKTLGKIINKGSGGLIAIIL
jgi:stage IV sporulation protein A